MVRQAKLTEKVTYNKERSLRLKSFNVFSALPPESVFEYRSDPMIRSAFEEPSMRKTPATEREDENEEHSDDFAIPPLSTPYASTPPPRPQMEKDESPLFSFSHEELERLKEAMTMLKNHGITI